MIYSLVIWTVVAGGGGSWNFSGWRELSQFHSNSTATAAVRCENAAKKLALKPNEYRCIELQ